MTNEVWLLLVVSVVLTTIPVSLVDREVKIPGWPDVLVVLTGKRFGVLFAKVMRSWSGRLKS